MSSLLPQLVITDSFRALTHSPPSHSKSLNMKPTALISWRKKAFISSFIRIRNLWVCLNFYFIVNTLFFLIKSDVFFMNKLVSFVNMSSMNTTIIKPLSQQPCSVWASLHGVHSVSSDHQLHTVCGLLYRVQQQAVVFLVSCGSDLTTAGVQYVLVSLQLGSVDGLCRHFHHVWVQQIAATLTEHET